MQDDPKEAKPSFRFMDYISLLPTTKVDLEDREQIKKLAERMREFTGKIAPINMVSEQERRRLAAQRLAVQRAINYIRGTGNPLLAMRLLEDGLTAADVQMFSGLKILHEGVDDAPLVLHRSKSVVTLAGGQPNSTYTLSYPFELSEVLPRLERRSPSVLKQGRKQAQKRRLAEATNTKPVQRTSGLLNGLLNGLSSTSKDTK